MTKHADGKNSEKVSLPTDRMHGGGFRATQYSVTKVGSESLPQKKNNQHIMLNENIAH